MKEGREKGRERKGVGGFLGRGATTGQGLFFFLWFFFSKGDTCVVETAMRAERRGGTVEDENEAMTERQTTGVT